MCVGLKLEKQFTFDDGWYLINTILCRDTIGKKKHFILWCMELNKYNASLLKCFSAAKAFYSSLLDALRILINI